MNAEPSRVTQAEVWAEWENRVINGRFPLRRFLGRSGRSAVFLSEYTPENLSNVAIKFVPADTLQTETQLLRWGTAAALSHPHLVRIFEAGRCQVWGQGFIYVVMEYAEQTLAQILPRRALSPDEVLEMLSPTLDALTYLHQNQLLHGQLKPSNFLVVNDRLKLASDTVRPIGTSTDGSSRTSLYDPPERVDGAISTAGDMWGLGMTLVEALTQHVPSWADDGYETISLPANFPTQFTDTVQRCLSRTPDDRPTVRELEARYRPAGQADVTPAPEPAVQEAPHEVTLPKSLPGRGRFIAGVAGVLLLSLAAWVGFHFSHAHQNWRQSTSDTPQAPGQPPASLSPPIPARAAQSTMANSAESNSASSSPGSPPAHQSSLSPADTSLAVLHEVSPDVPPAIRKKIRGHVDIKVRVLVDPSGNVVGEFLEKPGPSRYFARLASAAAEGWKFAPEDSRGSRVWLLRFEFTRTGVDVHATAAQ
jgi:serine/threonine protein kinase